jgi:hypothetical protein
MEGVMSIRRAVAAVLGAAIGVVAVPGVATGAAQPPGNKNWITLEGMCDGRPATLLDPKGGNTAFLVGGSVGVGKVFTFINAATGDVISQDVSGRGIDPDRLVTCEFMFENTEVPGVGVIDVLFRVQALVTPQGR